MSTGQPSKNINYIHILHILHQSKIVEQAKILEQYMKKIDVYISVEKSYDI